MNDTAPIGYNQKLKENEKHCIVCGKFFRRRGDRKFTAKFCSFKCKGNFQKGKNLTGGRPREGVHVNCGVCEKLFYTPKSSNAKYCSRICWNKVVGQATKGKNHYNWKGGIKPINQVLRSSKKYSNWRRKVFKRDNWICQGCGQRGGKLEAHHIKSWAKFPRERFKIKNGMTLCKKCHKKTDNYKRNGKTKK